MEELAKAQFRNISVQETVFQEEGLTRPVANINLPQGPFTEIVTSTLKLINPGKSRVCFIVKTTAPKLYCVRPNMGVVEKQGFITVSIMRQPTDSQPDEKSMGKFMIRAAAMPAGKTIDPRECLQNAGEENTVNYKFKAVSEVQEDPILFKALQEEDQKLAETLISRQDYDLTETDTKGYTALHLAVVKKNFSCVKKIIDREPCLITYPAKNGNAALHLAAEKGNERILRLLLDSRMCKINQQNKEGHTPLIVAAINNQLAVAKILLCFDADLNAEDCNGCTALHIVLENYQRTQLSNEEMSAVNPKIIEAEFDQNETNGLTFACFLLKEGADLYHKNHRWKTPDEILESQHLKGIVQEFCRRASSTSSCRISPRKVSLNGGCQICNDEIHAKLVPCGHSPVCYECGKCLFKACPECKRGVTGVEAVFDNLPICKVCEEERANLKFLPCGHRIACYSAVPRDSVEDLQEQLTCKICYERRNDAVFLCGHSTCSVCAETINLCPFCRKPVERIIRAYNT